MKLLVTFPRAQHTLLIWTKITKVLSRHVYISVFSLVYFCTHRLMIVIKKSIYSYPKAKGLHFNTLCKKVFLN